MPPWFQVAFCAIGPDPYVLKRDLYGPLRRDLDIITGKLRSKHP